MKLIECVPNFSEGRDLTIVTAIQNAIAAVDGVSVLNVTSDASHNRSVITFIAPYETAADAAFAGIRAARDRIDITTHQGVHPRIGAADVVPFVPLEGATMEDCIMLARTLGAKVGRDLEIPVYLYERAATRPDRQRLEDVRRGEFEGLKDEIEINPERVPDFGPSRLHPTFGAVAIGARPFLIAFNVYLGGAENLSVAKHVAKAVRTSSGGLPAVKALGLEVDGQAQVSMNLVDIDRTPLSVAFETVRNEALAHGVQVTWSEIIGLVPDKVLCEAAGRYLRLRQPVESHLLEPRILQARSANHTLSGYLDLVGSEDPAPGGGSVAAYVGALAAALARMTANLTLNRDKYAQVHSEMLAIQLETRRIATRLNELAAQDTKAYETVMEAYALPQRSDEETSARRWAIQDALLAAAGVPLEVARLCVRVAELSMATAERGNVNAITDAGTAAIMAEAACKAASFNVRVNVKSLGSVEGVQDLAKDAEGCVAATSTYADNVVVLVERTLSGS